MANLVLPSKYAEALFSLAKEKGIIGQVKDELVAIAKVMKDNPQLQQIIFHPGISAAEKKEIVNSLFGNSISGITKNFIMFLIDRKREKIFSLIVDVFIEKTEDHMGIGRVMIETAYSLDTAEKDKLVKQLEKTMDKKLRVDTKVNAGMLGGIIIRERMRIIDASVVQFLNTLKRRLHETKAVKKKKAAPKKKIKKAVKKKAKKTVKKKAVPKKKKAKKKIKKKK